jgi:hypothetical protein
MIAPTVVADGSAVAAVGAGFAGRLEHAVASTTERATSEPSAAPTAVVDAVVDRDVDGVVDAVADEVVDATPGDVADDDAAATSPPDATVVSAVAAMVAGVPEVRRARGTDGAPASDDRAGLDGVEGASAPCPCCAPAVARWAVAPLARANLHDPAGEPVGAKGAIAVATAANPPEVALTAVAAVTSAATTPDASALTVSAPTRRALVVAGGERETPHPATSMFLADASPAPMAGSSMTVPATTSSPLPALAPSTPAVAPSAVPTSDAAPADEPAEEADDDTLAPVAPVVVDDRGSDRRSPDSVAPPGAPTPHAADAPRPERAPGADHRAAADVAARRATGDFTGVSQATRLAVELGVDDRVAVRLDGSVVRVDVVADGSGRMDATWRRDLATTMHRRGLELASSGADTTRSGADGGSGQSRERRGDAELPATDGGHRPRRLPRAVVDDRSVRL